MRELQMVFNSDAIMRDFTRLSAGALYRVYAGIWSPGIPSLIGHDAHRLTGWAEPTALSFEPGLTRTHGHMLFPDNAEDQARLEATYRRWMADRIDEKAAQIEDLRRLLNGHLTGAEAPLDCGAAALVGPALARRVATQIFADEDKDGLVDIGELNELIPGVYRHGEVVVFAHPSLPLLDRIFQAARRIGRTWVVVAAVT